MKNTIALMGLKHALVKKADVREEIRDFVEEHPMALATLIGGGLGAVQGAFSDPEDRLKKALIGGGLGASHAALLNIGGDDTWDSVLSGLGGTGLAGMWLQVLKNRKDKERESMPQ